MPYVIVKSCRNYYGGPGYAGPSCDQAGIEPKKIYENFCDAINDARKLNEVNGVAWTIHIYNSVKKYDTCL